MTNRQKGLAFYREVLGMTQRPGVLARCRKPAGLMESQTQPIVANHFTIRVDDIDAAVTELQEQGGQASHSEQDRPTPCIDLPVAHASASCQKCQRLGTLDPVCHAGR